MRIVLALGWLTTVATSKDMDIVGPTVSLKRASATTELSANGTRTVMVDVSENLIATATELRIQISASTPAGARLQIIPQQPVNTTQAVATGPTDCAGCVGSEATDLHLVSLYVWTRDPCNISGTRSAACAELVALEDVCAETGPCLLGFRLERSDRGDSRLEPTIISVDVEASQRVDGVREQDDRWDPDATAEITFHD